MDELEKDFLAGLLDVPDAPQGDLQELTEITPSPQPTPKTSRKRQALSTIDTNVEPKQKKKKKTAKPDVSTGTILDVAEFDLASQQTTKEDEMLKDIKRILHAVLRMEKEVERLSKELKDHIEECGRQADDTPATGHMPPPTLHEVQPRCPFLPVLPQDTQPSEVFEGSEMLSPPALDRPPPTALESPSLDVPLPSPIGAVNPKFQELASSEIDKTQLKRIPDVLQKHKELRTECKITILAVKLAREAFFGDGILKRCTPRGWNELPTLPQAELNQLKATLFHQFPRFWTCPEEFEHKWTAAQESIAQACKRLRKL